MLRPRLRDPRNLKKISRFQTHDRIPRRKRLRGGIALFNVRQTPLEIPKN
jgi:hypothetical protein